MRIFKSLTVNLHSVTLYVAAGALKGSVALKGSAASSGTTSDVLLHVEADGRLHLDTVLPSVRQDF